MGPIVCSHLIFKASNPYFRLGFHLGSKALHDWDLHGEYVGGKITKVYLVMYESDFKNSEHIVLHIKTHMSYYHVLHLELYEYSCNLDFVMTPLHVLKCSKSLRHYFNVAPKAIRPSLISREHNLSDE